MLNCCIFIGRLTADPNYVNSDGEKVYSLTLVVNEFEMLFPKEKTIEDYEKIFNEGGED